MENVYFSHDSGVDDLTSLLMLLRLEQKGELALVGVGVVPADCYIEPAVSASQKMIQRFSKHHNLLLSQSDAKTNDPFPKEWRMQTFIVDALPILNEYQGVLPELSKNSAAVDLRHLLETTHEPITLIFTGPVSDLGRVLSEDPSLVEKIKRLVVMGGTFEVGNIAEPEQDGTAEWNVFWDPTAFDIVVKSGIQIEMVGLESTRQVPLTPEIRLRWASKRHHELIDFVGQMYATVPALTHFETNSTYYLWDVLTTLYAHNPSLGKQTTKNVVVHTSGPSRGRTEEKANGNPLQFIYDVEHDAFFDYFDSLLID